MSRELRHSSDRACHALFAPGTPAKPRERSLEVLGGVPLFDQHCLVVRGAGVDVLVIIERERSPCQPCFLRHAGWTARYECYPGHRRLTVLQSRALGSITRQAMARRPPLEPRPPERDRFLPRLVHLASLPDELEVQCTLTPDGQIRLRAALSDRGMTASCLLARPRSRGEGVLDWSLDAALPSDWPSGAIAALRRRVLVAVCVARLFPESLVVAGKSDDARPAIRVDLSDPRSLRALEGLHPAVRDDPPTLDLVVPSVCELRCVFCDAWAMRQGAPAAPRGPIVRPADLHDELAAPPASSGDDREAVRTAMELASKLRSFPNAVLQLTGEDPLRFSRLFELLHALGAWSLRIMTPGTRLADPSFTSELAGLGLDLSFHLTLHGPSAAEHDALAGRAGAFDELGAALRNCASRGMALELNHVLFRDNLALLPATLRTAARLGRPLQVLMPIFSDPAATSRWLAPFRSFREAFERSGDAGMQQIRRLWHFPLCALPPRLHALAQWGAHGLPAAHAVTCRACRRFGDPCPGPPAVVVQALGESVLEPYA